MYEAARGCAGHVKTRAGTKLEDVFPRKLPDFVKVLFFAAAFG